GTGKLLAVLACDAPSHHLTPGALALDRVHCLGGSVADAWPGETIAEVLGRLIAQMGRPAASLKDGGSARHKAVALLGAPALASVLTISRTPWLACASAGTKRIRALRLFWRPVVVSRARSSPPCWRVWRLPTYQPKPALCMCLVSAPGPIACCSSRQRVVPKGARPSPSCALAWLTCPPAKPSSRGCEAMPRLCVPARRSSQPMGSLTTPAPSVSRSPTPSPQALYAWSLPPIWRSSWRLPRPSGAITSACRSAPMPSQRFLGAPSTTV